MSAAAFVFPPMYPMMATQCVIDLSFRLLFTHHIAESYFAIQVHLQITLFSVAYHPSIMLILLKLEENHSELQLVNTERHMQLPSHCRSSHHFILDLLFSISG